MRPESPVPLDELAAGHAAIPSTPRQLVELRIDLTRRMQPGRLLHSVLVAEHMTNLVTPSRPVAEFNAARELDAFRASDLWWVTPDMTAMVIAAADSVPLDTTLSLDMMAALRVFCHFAQPVTMSDTEHDDAQCWVDAVQWAPMAYATEDGRSAQLGVMVKWFTWFAFPAGGVALLPIGGSTWYIDRPLGEPSRPAESDTRLRGEIEDRRLLAALWLLTTQPGIATAVDQQPDRATTRRAARASVPAAVRVVDLRVIEHAPIDGDHGHHGSPSVRFLVRGHWRQQPCGPGRQQRRPTWIAPHVKGPADAPLRVTQVVGILR